MPVWPLSQVKSHFKREWTEACRGTARATNKQHSTGNHPYPHPTPGQPAGQDRNSGGGGGGAEPNRERGRGRARPGPGWNIAISFTPLIRHTRAPGRGEALEDWPPPPATEDRQRNLPPPLALIVGRHAGGRRAGQGVNCSVMAMIGKVAGSAGHNLCDNLRYLLVAAPRLDSFPHNESRGGERAPRDYYGTI